MVNADYRVLICCSCHFHSSSLFFILASAVCKSLQGLISTLTQGGKGGHLFRLTCSLLSRGGRNTANKYLWRVWGVLTVYGPRSWCVLSRSTLLRLQGALQGHCPKWALCFVHFPSLSHSGSGSQVLHKGTDLVGHAFCALPTSKQLRQPAAWQVHCPRWTMCLNLPSPHHLVSRVCCTPSQVCCVSPLGS